MANQTIAGAAVAGSTVIAAPVAGSGAGKHPVKAHRVEAVNWRVKRSAAEETAGQILFDQQFPSKRRYFEKPDGVVATLIM
jgi:hypothetical protein